MRSGIFSTATLLRVLSQIILDPTFLHHQELKSSLHPVSPRILAWAHLCLLTPAGRLNLTKGKLPLSLAEHSPALQQGRAAWAKHSTTGDSQYAPHYSQFFSLEQNVSNSFAFYSASYAWGLTELWGQRKGCAGEPNQKHLWELQRIKSYLY